MTSRREDREEREEGVKGEEPGGRWGVIGRGRAGDVELVTSSDEHRDNGDSYRRKRA